MIIKVKDSRPIVIRYRDNHEEITRTWGVNVAYGIVNQFEEEDKKDGTYTKDCYEIYNVRTESIIPYNHIEHLKSKIQEAKAERKETQKKIRKYKKDIELYTKILEQLEYNLKFNEPFIKKMERELKKLEKEEN